MTTTETLLNSHRFTNALFTKIASTLSQKPLLKKGAFCYPPFPGMPAPFLRGCPSVRHGHSRVLFPDSFPVFPKGNRSFIGPLSGQTRNIPDLHPETNRPPAGNQRQPVMKTPFARIFANTSKTKALFPQNGNRHLRQPDRPKRSPCRFFWHQPFRNKSVPCPDTLRLTGACGN